MTESDILGLIASYAYASGLIVVAEVLHRRFGVSQDLTRKLVHVGAGMWVFGILALFDRWEIGIVPFATFIVLNYLFYRYRIFGSMDVGDSTPGTVYFAVAITLLFGLLWRPAGPVDRVPAAVAGAMALAWGDALAAFVGQRWGRHRYRVGGSERSLEGSAAMLLASFAVMFLVLVLLPGSPLSPRARPIGAGVALLAALLGAGAATLVEAVSPRGTDNLSVSLVAAGVALAVTELA
jgi:phytol kinase